MFKFRREADTTAPRLSLQYFALRFLDANGAEADGAFSRDGMGRARFTKMVSVTSPNFSRNEPHFFREPPVHGQFP